MEPLQLSRLNDKALIVVACFLAACLLAVVIAWSYVLGRASAYVPEQPSEPLTVNDYDLLTDAAKQQARLTGDSWFYTEDGVFVVMHNAPSQYWR